MEAEPTFTAFISHASADRERAAGICADLEARGMKCWIAPRDVRPGREYGQEILRGIQQSRCLVLVLSEAANNSTFVTKEVERAVSYGRPIFPVRIEEILPSRSLEFFVAGSQWVDAWGEQLVVELGRLADNLPRPSAEALSQVKEEAASTENGSGDRGPGGRSTRDPPFVSEHPGEDSPKGSRGRLGLGVLAFTVVATGVIAGPLLFGGEDGASSTKTADTSRELASDSLAITAEVKTTPDTVVVSTSALAAEPEPSEAEESNVTPPQDLAGLLVAVLGESIGTEASEFALLERVETVDGEIRSLTRRERSVLEGSVGPSEDLGRLQQLALASGFELLLVGELVTRARAGAGTFFSGSAELSFRLYTLDDGRLVEADRVTIGSGGVPGKLGSTETGAQEAAAQSVGWATGVLVNGWLHERVDRGWPARQPQ